MKGSLRLLLSPEMMVEAMQEWLDKHSYCINGKVTRVDLDPSGEFEVYVVPKPEEQP